MDIPTAQRVLEGNTAVCLDLLNGFMGAERSVRHNAATTVASVGADGYTAQVTAVRADYSNRAAQQRFLLNQAELAISFAISRCVPPEQEDLYSQNRRFAYWGRTRELMESGASTVAEVIATTEDPEWLASLKEELPSYMKMKGADQPAIDSAMMSITARYIELSPYEVEGEAAMRASALVEGADIRLTSVEKIVSGATIGGDMTAALSANMADQRNRAAIARIDAWRGDPDRKQGR